MMQAPPPAAEPITVNLTPPEVRVAAGAPPVAVVAEVRNRGTTVDQYSIEIENLEPSWYTVVTQSVSLFPGDSAPMRIELHPPKGTATRAGSYTFVVRARSHADPTLVGTTKGVVQVGSYTNFQAELAPKRVTGRRGRYNLSVANGGNQEVSFALRGRDAENKLRFSFPRRDVTVAPGSKVMVPVTVKPRGFRPIGDARRHPFALYIRPVDGQDKDAREVAGELIHKPAVRSLGRPFFAALILFAVLWMVSPAGPDLYLLPPPFGTWFSELQFWKNRADFFTRLFPQNASITPGGPSVSASPTPFYRGGFKAVHDAFPTLVGNALEVEWNDPSGNAHERTSSGDLIYIAGTNDFYFSGAETGQGKLYAFTVDNSGKIIQVPAK